MVTSPSVSPYSLVKYIDEVWTSGSSILFVDHYDHAIQRFWVAYLDDKVQVFCLINYFLIINISVILSNAIIITKAKTHHKLRLTCVVVNLCFCIGLEHCMCVCVCVVLKKRRNKSIIDNNIRKVKVRLISIIYN